MKKVWTDAQRKAQSAKLRKYHAARKATGSASVPTDQRLHEAQAAHSSLRDALIKDIVETLRTVSDADLLALYRDTCGQTK